MLKMTATVCACAALRAPLNRPRQKTAAALIQSQLAMSRPIARPNLLMQTLPPWKLITNLYSTLRQTRAIVNQLMVKIDATKSTTDSGQLKVGKNVQQKMLKTPIQELRNLPLPFLPLSPPCSSSETILIYSEIIIFLKNYFVLAIHAAPTATALVVNLIDCQGSIAFNTHTKYLKYQEQRCDTSNLIVSNLLYFILSI